MQKCPRTKKLGTKLVCKCFFHRAAFNKAKVLLSHLVYTVNLSHKFHTKKERKGQKAQREKLHK